MKLYIKIFLCSMLLSGSAIAQNISIQDVITSEIASKAANNALNNSIILHKHSFVDKVTVETTSEQNENNNDNNSFKWGHWDNKIDPHKIVIQKATAEFSTDKYK